MLFSPNLPIPYNRVSSKSRNGVERRDVSFPALDNCIKWSYPLSGSYDAWCLVV